MIVIVPDEPTASWLSSLFPGSFVKQIDIGLESTQLLKKPGRKTNFRNAKRVADHKDNELSKKRALIMSQLMPSFQEIGNDIFFKEGYIISQFYGWEFSTVTDLYGDPILVDGIDRYERILQKEASKALESKNAIPLMSPSFFARELSPETYKARDNVVCSTVLMFDFEDGDFRPNDFAKLFPRWRFVSYATHSSTPDRPRFRIVVFLDRTVEPHEYMAMSYGVLDRIIAGGFSATKIGNGTKAHGLDQSKLGPEALFRMPALPADPTAAHFKRHKSKPRGRLAVDEFLKELGYEKPVMASEAASITLVQSENVSRAKDVNRAERARERWQYHGTLEGNGNKGLYELAIELHCAGVPHDDIEAELKLAAATAHSPEERLRQVPTIMKSLAKL